MSQNITCPNDSKCKLLSKSEYKNERQAISSVFSALRTELANRSLPSFSQRMVGSAKRNMVYRYGDSEYDLDYQLDIMQSKKFPELPNNLKLQYDNALSEVFTDKKNTDLFPNENVSWHNTISTSVITVTREEVVDGSVVKYSYDLALINLSKNQINRGKKVDSTIQEENLRWEDLPSHNDAYTWFKNEATSSDITAIKEKYIGRKCDNRLIDKDSNDYRTSSELFVESVNNYRNETK